MNRNNNKISNEISNIKNTNRKLQRRLNKKKNARKNLNNNVQASSAGVSFDPTSGLAGAIAPQAMSQFAKYLPDLLSLIPFNTSGTNALAIPSNGGNGITTVTAPAANGAFVKTLAPKIQSGRNGSITIQHREFLSDVITAESNTFDIAFMAQINPGNKVMFPWLSGRAIGFESYNFRSLRFIYEMQSGSQTPGTVMMAVDFDCVDPPPSSKQQMMAYKGATRSPPWFAQVLDCARPDLHKSKSYYVLKTQEAPVNTDAKTYFVGQFFCATQVEVTADPVPVGELYVEYEVDLYTPQLDQIGADEFYLVGVIDDDGTSNSISSFGTLQVTFDLTISNVFSQEFYIEYPGLYRLTVKLEGPAGSADVPTLSINPLAGTSFENEFTGNGLNWPSFGNQFTTVGPPPVLYAIFYMYFQVAPGGFGISVDSPGDQPYNAVVIVTPCDVELYPFLGILPSSMKNYRLDLNRKRIRAIEKNIKTLSLKDGPQIEKKIVKKEGSISGSLPGNGNEAKLELKPVPLVSKRVPFMGSR